MEVLRLESIKKLNVNKKAGIYKIVINKKSYIGSSVTLKLRLQEHLLDLNSNKHSNSKLLRAFNKYKVAYVAIIEFCEEDKLIEREEFYYQIEGYYNLQSPFKVNNSQSKKVYQYDLEGNFINCYSSTGDASRKTGCHQTAISVICNHPTKKYSGGFLWSYKLENNIKRVTGKAKPTFMYDFDGNFVKEFYSKYDAARFLKKELNLKSEIACIASAVNSSIKRKGKGKAYKYLFTDYLTKKIDSYVPRKGLTKKYNVVFKSDELLGKPEKVNQQPS
jgi:group I intron endonuclease